MIEAIFHFLGVIKHFFQLGSAAGNEISTHRMYPYWSYTVSGDKRNNLM